MMRESSSGMLDLVNDLLDVAKLEAGKFTVAKSSEDVNALLDEKMRFFDTVARDAKIELVKTVGEQIPATVPCDKRRLGQVVANLLSNAIKFTGSGGTVRLQMFLHHQGQDVLQEAQAAHIVWYIDKQSREFAQKGDALCIAVTDTGVGIPKDKESQLFNKFQQFSTSTRHEAKGTGLGLVIAKGIVEAHGGFMGVASREDEGTTFYFTIPREG
jgi:signal transduction histidine kinase